MNQILTFSELRSPLLMVAGVLLLAPLARLNPKFFIDNLGILLLVHFLISLLSWGGGISLLWASYASNYSGNIAAFFGGDESVMVYLLLQAIAIGLVLTKNSEDISNLSKLFWWIILAATSVVIVASLRRGGVMCSAIMILSIFTVAGLGTKIRLTILMLLTLPIVGFVGIQLGLVDALLIRLAGEGNVATSDFGRDTDAIQALDHISKYFWFGTGSATRLALLRTQAYGIADSLSIHQSIYHIWVRFGVFGAVFYCLFFLQPCLRALGAVWRAADPRTNTAALPLVVGLSGLIFALFIWGLFIPVIFINFRQAGVWILAAVLVYALTRQRGPAPQGNPTPGEYSVEKAN